MAFDYSRICIVLNNRSKYIYVLRLHLPVIQSHRIRGSKQKSLFLKFQLLTAYTTIPIPDLPHNDTEREAMKSEELLQLYDMDTNPHDVADTSGGVLEHPDITAQREDPSISTRIRDSMWFPDELPEHMVKMNYCHEDEMNPGSCDIVAERVHGPHLEEHMVGLRANHTGEIAYFTDEGHWVEGKIEEELESVVDYIGSFWRKVLGMSAAAWCASALAAAVVLSGLSSGVLRFPLRSSIRPDRDNYEGLDVPLQGVA